MRSRSKYTDGAIYGGAVLVILFIGAVLLFSGAREYPELLGMGVLSFTLGLRHAFDADHISAIDNMARKLVQQQKNPKGVGFFFSCGHSTVVIIMGVTTIFAVKWAEAKFPQFQAFGGVIATAISGGFLLLLALINLVILKDVLRTFKNVRRGNQNPESPDQQASTGLISRAIKFLFNMVSKNWHVFVVGLLFGLGFDTATQIAVLATSAGAASESIPLISILSFPILFTAGMSMMDTLDGFFMTTAYQWVLYSPLRKVYYNLTITGLSILAAGVIGIIEVAQVISKEIGLGSGFWLQLQHLNFNVMGFILVGMFVVVWVASLAGWKLLRLGDKEKQIASREAAQG
jgi:high-affinity nickel-transport protein